MSSLYNNSEVQFGTANGQRQLSHEMSVAPLAGIMMTAFSWPHGVSAAAPCLEDTYDFCAPTQGTGEIVVGKEKVSFDHASGVVLSPSRSMRIQTGNNNVSLNVNVPRPLIEAQLRALTGCELQEPLEFEAALRCQREPLAGVWRLVRFIADEIDRDESVLLNRLVRERFCETVLTGFLYAQPHTYSSLLHSDVPPAELRYICQVEEFIAAHCEQPINVRDLATIAGVGMSALYAGFKRHRGYTPLEFLKNTRLLRVRTALLAATPGTTVREIARRWGFNHMGRFSRNYGLRFGEFPSKTLARGNR
jgi:AraC-like DNA-binding protein